MSARLPEPLTLADYARQVRRALDDLPPPVLDDLLEDLEDHLAEVAAEPGSLALLGSPGTYAAELRRAAGLPPASSTLYARQARVQDGLQRLRTHEAVRPVLAFLPELRPAWWVLRAWLALLALDYLFGSGYYSFPLPSALGFGAVLSVPLVAAAVVLSVRLGRRAARDPRPDPRRRLVLVGGNAVLGLLALIALVAVQERSNGPVYADGYSSPATPSVLVRSDGSPITNLYPYSATGQPLTGVLLYDQDGRAVENLAETTDDGRQIERVVPPGSAPAPANGFPQQQQVLNWDGSSAPTPQPFATTGPTPSPTLAPATVPPPVLVTPTDVPATSVPPTDVPLTPVPSTPVPSVPVPS